MRDVVFLGLCVIFSVWIAASIILGFNPRWWWCELFHKKYITRMGVCYEFSIKCSKCGRHQEWSEYV